MHIGNLRRAKNECKYCSPVQINQWLETALDWDLDTYTPEHQYIRPGWSAFNAGRILIAVAFPSFLSKVTRVAPLKVVRSAMSCRVVMMRADGGRIAN